MRLNSTTPSTSAAMVNTTLYRMDPADTLPVPRVAARNTSMGAVMGLSSTSTFRRGLSSSMDRG